MISDSIIVALITGGSAFLATFLTNNKAKGMMEEKINELTAKVEKHNNLVERIYKMEAEVENIKDFLGQSKSKLN